MLAIDRHAARLLMPSLRNVVDALAFAHGDIEAAADELRVDDLMLQVGLSAVTEGQDASAAQIAASVLSKSLR